MGAVNQDTTTTTTSTTTTLYDRLGGDAFVPMLTESFFDEMLENPELSRFFQHISMSALKSHQVKFFRVLLGPDDEKPSEADLLDYLVQTHARLFRDMGLNEHHFDECSEALLSALQSFQIKEALAEEVVTIWNSTRPVFVYGARVAQQEKSMTADELENLPLACRKTMAETPDLPVTLPSFSQTQVPDWLHKALAKAHNQTDVRAWTCDLTDRFGSEDCEIAGTFLYQPYMAHHVYLVAFLELAFLPDADAGLVDTQRRLEILDIVLYPRGRDHSVLSRKLFDRMVEQFTMTCNIMGLPQYDTKAAVAKLQTFRQAFGKRTDKNDGLKAPHVLCRGQHHHNDNDQDKPKTRLGRTSTGRSKDKDKKGGRSKSPKADGNRTTPGRSRSKSPMDDLMDDNSQSTYEDSSRGSGRSIGSSKGGRGSTGGGWLNFFSGKKKAMHVVR